jgi:hypothetical protein
MGEMADMALEQVMDFEEARASWWAGRMSVDEAYERVVIDEFGHDPVLELGGLDLQCFGPEDYFHELVLAEKDFLTSTRKSGNESLVRKPKPITIQKKHMSDEKTSNRVMLKNVRLSFPALFKTSSFQGSEPKYEATFILDNEDNLDDIAKLKAAIAECASEKWGKKIPKDLKIGLRDGSEKELDGYGPGTMFLCAKSKNRPTVIDRDKSPLTEEDGTVYAGCWVNAQVSPWAQDNQFGRRVNFNLVAVQFRRDGEPFGDASFDPDDFEVVEDEEMDMV